jgi:hypothetical protein
MRRDTGKTLFGLPIIEDDSMPTNEIVVSDIRVLIKDPTEGPPAEPTVFQCTVAVFVSLAAAMLLYLLTTLDLFVKRWDCLR